MGEQTYFKLEREYSFDALVKLNQPISCRSEIDFFVLFCAEARARRARWVRHVRVEEHKTRSACLGLCSLLTLFPQADK